MSASLQHDIAQLIDQNRRLAEEVERLQMERHELTLEVTKLQMRIGAVYSLLTRGSEDARQQTNEH